MATLEAKINARARHSKLLAQLAKQLECRLATVHPDSQDYPAIVRVVRGLRRVSRRMRESAKRKAEIHRLFAFQVFDGNRGA